MRVSDVYAERGVHHPASLGSRGEAPAHKLFCLQNSCSVLQLSHSCPRRGSAGNYGVVVTTAQRWNDVVCHRLAFLSVRRRIAPCKCMAIDDNEAIKKAGRWQTVVVLPDGDPAPRR